MKLDGTTSFTPVHVPPHLARRILDSRGQLQGERKQITILFADIKGSTSIVADLDPEQADLRLRPALHAMIKAVHRYEGTINRVQGDGIMALFGAPLAHEDNAVRAAFAALDMQNAIQDMSDPDIAIRVGLHAGEVVVQAIHNDLSVNYEAIGPSVHLAARMEQMAPPGTIYCTASVARLAEGLLTVRPLGHVAVRGIRDPMDLFQITGHTAARTRWEVTAARGFSRFVGREEELASLHRALDLASTSKGQLVAVVGEPGTGKSRLVHEFVKSAELSKWTVLKTATIAYQRNTPYFAFAGLLRAWCDIADQTPPEEIKRRIRERVGKLGEELLPILPALHFLLELSVDDPEWSLLEPAGRRRQIISAAKQLILAGAAKRPLILWFEDLQWMDTETQNLLDDLINEMSTSQLMIIATYRPEHENRWADKSFYSAIHVDPLSPVAADELVQTLLPEQASNSALRSTIVQRTDGTPLFIEETIRALAESGTLNDGVGTLALTGDPREIKIPATVQAVLATRIDRLPAEQKLLLQTASVIGPEVPFSLLRVITGLPDPTLQDILAHLQAAHFLYEAPRATSVQYNFKHSLTHEVAYGTLLSSTRQTLHAQVLQAMEIEYKDNLHELAESLSHHAINGGLWQKALGYLRQAGNKAIELSAYHQADLFFRRALEVLGHLPPDTETVRQVIDIRLNQRAIFGATAEYDRLENCLAEAEALAKSINDRRRLAGIYIARTLANNWRGELEASIQFGMLARTIAQEIGDEAAALSASFGLGQAYMWLGNFRESLNLLESNVAWTEGPLRHRRIGTTGTSSVLWLGMLAACHAYLGNFRSANSSARAACVIAEEVRRPYDIAYAYWYAGFVSSHQGDIVAALAALERAFSVCRAGQINFMIPIISTSLGYTYALAGRAGEGIELLTKAVAFSRSAKFHYNEAWSTLYLGLANLLHGRTEGMIEHAKIVLEFARSHNHRAVEASGYRLMAEACRRGMQFEDAEHNYVRGSNLAADLGLRPEYAHCQRGLAELYMLTCREKEADPLLNAAFDLYRSMDMILPSPSIVEAHAKLADV
jgi:class 3 adenylate cyclase/tetratricopeptide (TPR) repeat protein